MKKALATFCLIGGALTLTACDTTSLGDRDLQPPYAMERTATHSKNAAPVVAKQTYTSSPVARTAPSRVAPAEPVFRRAQTK